MKSVFLREKKPLESKKFVAFVIAEITWKILILVMVFRWDAAFQVPLIMAIVVDGFLQAMYISGQARIDLNLSKGHLILDADGDEANNGISETKDEDSPETNDEDEDSSGIVPTD